VTWAICSFVCFAVTIPAVTHHRTVHAVKMILVHFLAAVICMNSNQFEFV